MSPYVILQAESSDDLEDMVGDWLAKGFIPLGSVCVSQSGTNYAQAVCSPTVLIPAMQCVQAALTLKPDKCSKSKTNAA